MKDARSTEIDLAQRRLDALIKTLGPVEGAKAARAMQVLEEYDGDPHGTYDEALRTDNEALAQHIDKQCREAGIWS